MTAPAPGLLRHRAIALLSALTLSTLPLAAFAAESTQNGDWFCERSAEDGRWSCKRQGQATGGTVDAANDAAAENMAYERELRQAEEARRLEAAGRAEEEEKEEEEAARYEPEPIPDPEPLSTPPVEAAAEVAEAETYAEYAEEQPAAVSEPPPPARAPVREPVPAPAPDYDPVQSGDADTRPDYQRLAYVPERPMSLLELPGSFWVAQLMAVSSKEFLEEYAAEHKLRGLSAARVASGDRLFYILILGIYENRNLAQQAIADLPPPYDQYNPFLRSLKSLQQAMQRADEIAGGSQF